MKYLSLFILLIFITNGVLGQTWETFTLTDDFTDEITNHAFINGEGEEFPYTNPLVVFTLYEGNIILGFSDAGYWDYDGMKFKIRVDKNDRVYTENDINFDISKGYTTIRLYEESPFENTALYDLIQEMKSGSVLKVLLENDYSSNRLQFKLSGSDKALSTILKN